MTKFSCVGLAVMGLVASLSPAQSGNRIWLIEEPSKGTPSCEEFFDKWDIPTINALAQDMVMDRTTLGRNILPLERNELIRIEPAASDRRAKELHLTKAGEKRLEAARKRWSVAQARFEVSFGAMRAADLRASLRAVVANEFS
jgi:DNA-binding MarR family transcriptional regulator